METDSKSSEPSPRKTYRLMAGMAVVAIVLIGVAIYSLSQLRSNRITNPLKQPDFQNTFRKELPHFEAQAAGKMIKSSDFQGKWTLLSFWAYWCVPCLEELPDLDQFAQTWQGPEINILTVDIDSPKSADFNLAKKFLSDSGIALPTIFDTAGNLKKTFGVRDVPAHFLIDPQGQIVWQARGAFKWNDDHTRDQLIKLMARVVPDADSAPAEE